MAKNNRKNTHLTDYKWKQFEHNIDLLKQRDRRMKNKLKDEPILDTINFVDWQELKNGLKTGKYAEEEAQDIYKLTRQSVKTFDNYYKIETDKATGEIKTIQSANPEKQEIYNDVKQFESSMQSLENEANEFINAYNATLKGSVHKKIAKIERSITEGKDPARIDEKVRKLYGESYTYEDVQYKYDKTERYRQNYLNALGTIATRNEEYGEDYTVISELKEKLEGKDALWFKVGYEQGLLPSIQDFYGYVKVPDDTQPEGYRLVKKPTDEPIDPEIVNDLLNDDVIEAIDKLTGLARQEIQIKNVFKQKQKYRQIQKKVGAQKAKQAKTTRPSVQLHRKYGV